MLIRYSDWSLLYSTDHLSDLIDMPGATRTSTRRQNAAAINKENVAPSDVANPAATTFRVPPRPTGAAKATATSYAAVAAKRPTDDSRSGSRVAAVATTAAASKQLQPLGSKSNTTTTAAKAKPATLAAAPAATKSTAVTASSKKVSATARKATIGSAAAAPSSENAANAKPVAKTASKTITPSRNAPVPTGATANKAPQPATGNSDDDESSRASDSDDGEETNAMLRAKLAAYKAKLKEAKTSQSAQAKPSESVKKTLIPNPDKVTNIERAMGYKKGDMEGHREYLNTRRAVQRIMTEVGIDPEFDTFRRLPKAKLISVMAISRRDIKVFRRYKDAWPIPYLMQSIIANRRHHLAVLRRNNAVSGGGGDGSNNNGDEGEFEGDERRFGDEADFHGGDEGEFEGDERTFGDEVDFHGGEEEIRDEGHLQGGVAANEHGVDGDDDMYVDNRDAGHPIQDRQYGDHLSFSDDGDVNAALNVELDFSDEVEETVKKRKALDQLRAVQQLKKKNRVGKSGQM
ncbi:hypothetical protein CVT24_004872 [Panaeolus cyanescens]|uniref:Uncharacterized protein n=1 Tax=Panaeolus cyanescens TaxID=181874 RepID=A0A409VD84_9AGAR|nr:hypothetical protein CVT24_004872 [Panaeolus cyanescens]